MFILSNFQQRMVGGQIFFIFCALFFALQLSTLNAYYLNNNGYDNGYGDFFGMKKYEQCSGCFLNQCGCLSYVCRIGKGYNNEDYTKGVDCIENVVRICGLSPSEKYNFNFALEDKELKYKNVVYFNFKCTPLDYDDVIEEEEEVDGKKEAESDEDSEAEEDEEDGYFNAKMDQKLKKRYGKYNGKLDALMDQKKNIEIMKKKIFESYTSAKASLETTKNAFEFNMVAADDILKSLDGAYEEAKQILRDGDYLKNRIFEKSDDVKHLVFYELSVKLEILKANLKRNELKYSNLKRIIQKSEGNIQSKFNAIFDDFQQYTTDAKKLSEEYLKVATESVNKLKEFKKGADELLEATIKKKAAEICDHENKQIIKRKIKSKKQIKN